jgi:hypothetical protein
MEFVPIWNARQYDDAVPLMEQALRQAAAESPERLAEVARGIVAWKGFFANDTEAQESERCFRWVLAILAELAGPESAAAMAAAENLASILGWLGQAPEAIALPERVFTHVRGRFAVHDPRCMSVREGLAFLYRRAGEDRKAEELYRNLGLCEHPQPAERFLRDAGVSPASFIRPWSGNCHVWAYCDAVLDCERPIETLGPDPRVRIHDHRGTHDRSERSLACSVHHDAVMGAYPAHASPERRSIP